MGKRRRRSSNARARDQGSDKEQVENRETVSPARSTTDSGHSEEAVIEEQGTTDLAEIPSSSIPAPPQLDQDHLDVFGLVVRQQRLERFLEETGQRLSGLGPKASRFEQQLEAYHWNVETAVEQFLAARPEASTADTHSSCSNQSENDDDSVVCENQAVAAEGIQSSNSSCSSATLDQETEDEQENPSDGLTTWKEANLLDEFKILAGGRVTSQAEFRLYLKYWNQNLARAWIEWRADRHDALMHRSTLGAEPTLQFSKSDTQPHISQAEDPNEQNLPTDDTESDNDMGDDEIDPDLSDPERRPIKVEDEDEDEDEATTENDPEQAPPDCRPNLMRSIIPFNNNMEQERRDAAVVLAHQLGATHQLVLSKSEAILHLHLSRWDLSVALERFQGVSQFHQSLSDEFDHTRQEDPAQVERSQRLALLLNITQRPDVFSVQHHLQTCKWNFITALLAWMDDGIAVSKNPKARKDAWRRKDHDKRPQAMPAAGDVWPNKNRNPFQWAQDPAEFMPGGTARKRRQPPPTKNAIGREQGFILGYDSRVTRAGVPKYELLNLEYIQKGTLRHNTYHHQSNKWLPDSVYGASESLKALPVFDWTNEGDITRLKTWRKQAIFRISQEPSRAASQAFTPEMNDFLYQLSAEYAEKLADEEELGQEGVIPFTVPASVQKSWHRQFNARFVGTQPEGFDAPVEPRTLAAVFTQRTRIPKLCADFGVTPKTRAHSRAQKRKAELAEEEESEAVEEESDDESSD